jgi:predicted RNA-binding Zn ribbon-like protein
MSNSSQSDQLTFMAVGEHAALDFLNTVVMRNGEACDLLQSDADVHAWLATFELASVESENFERGGAGELLQHARNLREAARKMIGARKAGATFNARVLNVFLRCGASFWELRWMGDTPDARVPHRIARRVADSPAALMRPVAEAIAELLETADFDLVKKCENPECSMMFCDHTKSHRRRWCSAMLCGNRMKVAAFRERMKLKI